MQIQVLVAIFFLCPTHNRTARSVKRVESIDRQKPENGTRSVVVSFRERAMRLPPPRVCSFR